MFRKVSALAIADMKRFWRDPTAMFFTIFFPLIFLLIFGTIFGGNDDAFSARIALENNSTEELAGDLETRLRDSEAFEIEEFETIDDRTDALTRSQIRAIVVIDEDFGQDEFAPAQVKLQYLASEETNLGALRGVLNTEIFTLNNEIAPYTPPIVPVDEPVQEEALDSLDYLTSGIMGFAIFGLAIFGMANGFTADKKTGAIARLRVAPITAMHVVLSTAVVYAILAVVAVAILVAAAILLFDFNMIGDWFSFAVFTVISTVSLLGIGTILGGWAKNDKQAAPIAQVIAFPMWFLSGVFFPIFLMPDWVQSISRFIPLTAVNDGLRLISSEGFFLTDVWQEILVLAIWAVISYPIAFKVFRWEGS